MMFDLSSVVNIVNNLIDFIDLILDQIRLFKIFSLILI